MKTLLLAASFCAALTPAFACEVVTPSADGSMPANLYGPDAPNHQINGLYPDFANAVSAMFLAMELDIGGKATVNSGYRSIEAQIVLWNNKLADLRAQYPNWSQSQIESAAAKKVARPGRSNHQFGLAVDMYWNGQSPHYNPVADQWLAANLSRFGLIRRMSYESWHIEPFNWSEIRQSMLAGATYNGQPIMDAAECSEAAEGYMLPPNTLMPWGEELGDV